MTCTFVPPCTRRMGMQFAINISLPLNNNLWALPYLTAIVVSRLLYSYMYIVNCVVSLEIVTSTDAQQNPSARGCSSLSTTIIDRISRSRRASMCTFTVRGERLNSGQPME